MEPLYPQNILERKYPILREQREKAEREALFEKRQSGDSVMALLQEFETELHRNEPNEVGPLGQHLNTLA